MREKVCEPGKRKAEKHLQAEKLNSLISASVSTSRIYIGANF